MADIQGKEVEQGRCRDMESRHHRMIENTIVAMCSAMGTT